MEHAGGFTGAAEAVMVDERRARAGKASGKASMLHGSWFDFQQPASVTQPLNSSQCTQRKTTLVIFRKMAGEELFFLSILNTAIFRQMLVGLEVKYWRYRFPSILIPAPIHT